MKREGTIAAPLYLTFHGHEEELDAIFVIEVETYPAEPTTWGASRGDETEVSARLLCWERHGEMFCRADAVALEGEARVIEQEEATAASAEPSDLDDGDYGDWLYSVRRDDGAPVINPIAAE